MTSILIQPPGGGGTDPATSLAAATANAREKALQDFRKKLLEHNELDSRLKESKYSCLPSHHIRIYFHLRKLATIQNIAYGVICIRILSQSTI